MNGVAQLDNNAQRSSLSDQAVHSKSYYTVFIFTLFIAHVFCLPNAAHELFLGFHHKHKSDMEQHQTFSYGPQSDQTVRIHLHLLRSSSV